MRDHDSLRHWFGSQVTSTKIRQLIISHVELSGFKNPAKSKLPIGSTRPLICRYIENSAFSTWIWKRQMISPCSSQSVVYRLVRGIFDFHISHKQTVPLTTTLLLILIPSTVMTSTSLVRALSSNKSRLHIYSLHLQILCCSFPFSSLNNH